MSYAEAGGLRPCSLYPLEKEPPIHTEQEARETENWFGPF